jgi:hypothetical protein
MELDRKTVLNETEVISVSEYIETYCKGLKPQSIYYAMDNDLVDWVNFGGREKYIAMTEKTKLYSPNESKKRAVMSL